METRSRLWMRTFPERKRSESSTKQKCRRKRELSFLFAKKNEKLVDLNENTTRQRSTTLMQNLHLESCFSAQFNSGVHLVISILVKHPEVTIFVKPKILCISQLLSKFWPLLNRLLSTCTVNVCFSSEVFILSLFH